MAFLVFGVRRAMPSLVLVELLIATTSYISGFPCKDESMNTVPLVKCLKSHDADERI